MKTVIPHLFWLFSAFAVLSPAKAADSCILNQPNPIITTQDVLGTYRRLPLQNDFHVGTITLKGGTTNTLVWTNQAGVSWNLTPDFANSRLLTGPDNPYQSSPGIINFNLQFQSGKVLGFKFGNDLFTKDAPFFDVFDPTTGQLTINSVTVGASNYCNVVVTLNKLISVGTAPANGNNDTFDASTGQLSIPSVKVGDATYYNVVITVGNILSVGGMLPSFNPTTSLKGYATQEFEAEPSDYHYGFSLYTNIHKVSDYQIQNLSFGWGTWLVPDNSDATFSLCPAGTVEQNASTADSRFLFQTIEGGPGQWDNTHFPSPIAKFRLNSTPSCYNDEIASPGYDFTGKVLNPGMLGIAQLSNQLLIAPDGLTFNLNNQPSALFGYGYFALPLIPANGLIGTQAVGNQSWVLFVNSHNFKGPVSFYVPKLYTLINALDFRLAGRGMDARPAFPGTEAIEIGQVPAYTATDAAGVTYRRIAKMSFPTGSASSQSIVTQDVKTYAKQALWNSFAASPAEGVLPSQFDPSGSYSVVFKPYGSIWVDMGDTNEHVVMDSWVTTNQGQGTAFSLSWLDPNNAGALPEYYRKDGSIWTPVPVSQVPAITNLTRQNFPAQVATGLPSLDTSSNSPWSSSKWAAGPFTAKLNDGSTVTYVWYKFINQPAIAQLGLDAVTLQNLQSLVEKMHAQYGVNGPTLAPPSSGNLVSMDAGLLVTPPSNLSVGYVPIAIGQQ